MVREDLYALVAAAVLCAACPAATRVVSARQSVAPPASINSPTGRNPRLLWTPDRQAVWAHMKADYDANPLLPATLGGRWYKLMKTNAECACKYSDNGIWPTLMYQATGDPKYVSLAWSRLQQSFFPLTGSALTGNFARENFAELVVFYDWLYPGLTSVQRAQFVAKLNEMETNLVTGNAYTDPDHPIRVDDTDQTTGSYFGIVFLYLATGDYNPTAVDVYSRAFVGGLDATAVDRATLRNAVGQYVTQMAAGGEWIESSQYNLGTVRLLLMGAEGVRTATGQDHFAEVTRFATQAALRPIYFITPDRKASVQWGDDEHPRAFRDMLYSWETTNAMLAGLTQDSSAGPYIEQFVSSLTDLYGDTGYLTAEPWARAFYFYNPYAPRADWRTLPRTFYAPGQGLLITRDGWSAASTLLEVHMPQKQLTIDHQVSYFGDFQVYRKGEWALTHPITYAGPSLFGDGTNSMLLGSFSSMAEYKSITAAEFAGDGSYAYLTGTTGGQKSAPGAYLPPATFLHEWTRSVFYLPSLDAHSDTVVVFDRTNARNPVALPNFDRYRTKSPDEQTAIRSELALKQWIIHAPVAPTVSPQTISWSTANNDLTVSTLLPSAQNRTVYNENDLWTDSVVIPSEKKWQVRVTPAAEAQWDTFLNVVQASDHGLPLTNTLVTSSAGETQGVLIQRPQHDEVLVLFNAVQGPDLPQPTLTNGFSAYNPAVPQILSQVHWLQNGYSVTWNGTPGRTQSVFLVDLSPSASWSASVDGAAPSAIVVSDHGIGRLRIAGGTGKHVIKLTRSN
jgi:hypothetical protein